MSVRQRRRAAELPPEDSVLSVVNRNTRRIDLSQQKNAVTTDVLEGLRDVLYLNDFYTQLSLSNNVIRDDTLAMVCALLKEKTYIEILELQNCSLGNKDFTFYLVPAILSRHTVRKMDISNNKALDDSSADAMCRLIKDGDLVELHLLGTSLTHRGGTKIVEAMSGNGSLEVCELPFTVGFGIIEQAKLFLERNQLHCAMVRDEQLRQTELEEMVEVADGVERNTLLKRVLASPLAHMSDGSPLGTNKTQAAKTASEGGGRWGVEHSIHNAKNVGLTPGIAKQEQFNLARYKMDRGRKNALKEGRYIAPSRAVSSRTLSGASSVPSLTEYSRIYGRQSTLSGHLPPIRGGGEGGVGGDGDSISGCSRSGGVTLDRAVPALRESMLCCSPAGALMLLPSATPRHRQEYQYRSNNMLGSLESVSLKDWTDPAVRKALTQLHLLSERSQLRDEYRAHARRQLREKRGLPTD